VTKRSFTPAEANRTLPLVKRIVGDLLAGGRELRALAPRRAQPECASRMRALELEIRELAEELERIGCSYKDWGFEAGLVDFPAELEGVPVLLCWKSDEQRVAHYHTYESGFAGRLPIPAELLEPESGGA